jgi:tetratricopeptide (TPR) repeat protein
VTRAALAAALGVSLAACAAQRAGRPAPGRIAVEEAERVAGAPSDLAGKNAEELFAAGLAAYSAGDFARAGDAFGRVADLFPASPRRAAALFDAGLAYRQLGDFRLALERFRELADGYAGADADEARFLVADAHWRLGERAEARRVLDALAGRADLPPERHARALVERGVLDAEDGDLDAADRSLLAGARSLEGGGDREREDGALLAKARYWLGEVARARFLRVKVDPAGDAARLERDLEAKSQLLLAAQGQYLAAIRAGTGQLAVTAGGRVGELYEALYGELVSAPLPAGLDEEGGRAYRAELRQRVRVLVTKAIEAYEDTLAAARRARLSGDAVPRVEAALERMKKVLAEIDAPEARGS